MYRYICSNLPFKGNFLKVIQIISMGKKKPHLNISSGIMFYSWIISRVALRVDKLFWGSFLSHHVLYSLWYRIVLYASIPEYKSTFWQTLGTSWVMINECCLIGLTPVIFYLVKIQSIFSHVNVMVSVTFHYSFSFLIFA